VEEKMDDDDEDEEEEREERGVFSLFSLIEASLKFELSWGVFLGNNYYSRSITPC